MDGVLRGNRHLLTLLQSLSGDVFAASETGVLFCGLGSSNKHGFLRFVRIITGLVYILPSSVLSLLLSYFFFFLLLLRNAIYCFEFAVSVWWFVV